jgi:hypothetical protein
MPLSLPNLDDRRYKDLVEEALALIPSRGPGWTNHNPSDPGITLVELFAYLTEMMVYRVNRITDDNIRAFLRLVNGPKWQQRGPLGAEIREAILELRRTVRAVTPDDYEMLAVAAHPKAARAHCLPRRNLQVADPFAAESPGHVSVVVVNVEGEKREAETRAMLGMVRERLELSILLTTRLHVVAPRYVTLSVQTTLETKPGAKDKAGEDEPPAVEQSGEGAQAGRPQKGVVELAGTALKGFFHPLRGGPEGKGWPFGRSIYVSEIYALLDKLSGVDYISELNVSIVPRAGETAAAAAARAKRDANGVIYAFELQPDELVSESMDLSGIRAKRPTVKLK